ncbi:hypothetical protein JHD47_06560 [Sulfurimonas sp. SAG-AH-194-L11]|nr:PelD GGDEF domain-containing protein [Sulfurimonas sp. SAG-AH-194-L11]MDF1877475.1 hypothetical protein [Sulfurimonas sp. SAG-AH-194-L11]
MEVKSGRVKEKTKIETLLKLLHEYAYIETIIMVAMYLGIGYLIDSTDICMLNSDVSFILILLAVITLFHGFENGILALSILAIAMALFYPRFLYIEFLVALMMTLIFSEFHYYWTQKIKKAEIQAQYRGTKLDELSKAFYTLKISHDQLEKNYVIKPMSIRNSIEYIINQKISIDEDESIVNKQEEYYNNFLTLLEKSFNVNSALIIHKKNIDDDSVYLDENNSVFSYTTLCEKRTPQMILEDFLVDKAISRKTPIYISDDLGEPTVTNDINSLYLAAIPALESNKITSVLVIEKMPFMSFNRENLTSISILLEYFSIEISKKDLLSRENELSLVEDESFQYEFERMKYLYKKFDVNSILLVLRIDNELQATRVYERILKMLRSLDMVTLVRNKGYFYITLLFPLHDKAAALGYLNRLLHTLEEEKDKKFNYMTFDLSKTELLNKYYTEDYNG